MASERERARLARAAFLLNARAGFEGKLPPLVLMTDERLRDPVAAATALPERSGVIVRHRNERERAILAKEMAQIARAHKLVLLIAGDPSLANEVEAMGLHLSEARMSDVTRWRAWRPDWLITVAAHSLAALRHAAEVKAHSAFLGPVFPTRSHPGREPLGPQRFAAMVRASRVPVYALGGISCSNIGQLGPIPIAGIAAVDALVA